MIVWHVSARRGAHAVTGVDTKCTIADDDMQQTGAVAVVGHTSVAVNALDVYRSLMWQLLTIKEAADSSYS